MFAAPAQPMAAPPLTAPGALTTPSPWSPRSSTWFLLFSATGGAVCAGTAVREDRVHICRKAWLCVLMGKSNQLPGVSMEKEPWSFQLHWQRAGWAGTPAPVGLGGSEAQPQLRVLLQLRGLSLALPKQRLHHSWSIAQGPAPAAPPAAFPAPACLLPLLLLLLITHGFFSQLPLRLGHQFQQHERPHGGLRESQ